MAQPGVKSSRSRQDNLLRMVDVLRCCERREVVDGTLDAKLLGAREARCGMVDCAAGGGSSDSSRLSVAVAAESNGSSVVARLLLNLGAALNDLSVAALGLSALLDLYCSCGFKGRVVVTFPVIQG